MTDGERSYVLGYVCPACKAESLGIPIPDLGGRRTAGWILRVPDSPDMRIVCSSCGAEIPRAHWRFAGDK